MFLICSFKENSLEENPISLPLDQLSYRMNGKIPEQMKLSESKNSNIRAKDLWINAYKLYVKNSKILKDRANQYSSNTAKFIHNIMKSKIYNYLINIIILINIIFLCVKNFESTREQYQITERVNFSISIFMALNNIVKIIFSKKPRRKYTIYLMNLFILMFDIICTVVESIDGNFLEKPGNRITYLSRSLKLFLGYQFLKNLKFLEISFYFFKEMIRTLANLGYYLLFILMFLYLWSCVGYQLFSNRGRNYDL